MTVMQLPSGHDEPCVAVQSAAAATISWRRFRRTASGLAGYVTCQQSSAAQWQQHNITWRHPALPMYVLCSCVTYIEGRRAPKAGCVTLMYLLYNQSKHLVQGCSLCSIAASHTQLEMAIAHSLRRRRAYPV
jgi:hypothetical protein